MKRLLIPGLAVLMLYAVACFVRYYTLPPEVQAQTNTFCAANLACTISAAWTYSSTLTISGNELNKNLEGFMYADQFAGADAGAKVNAAIAALPSSNGTVIIPNSLAGSFATTISINSPVHLIFDAGTFTYTGSGSAISIANVSQVAGATIEGVQGGYDTGCTTGTVISLTNTAANGINGGTAAGMLGTTLRNFQICGPGSGTGIGINLVQALNNKIQQVQVKSMGGDGFFCAGTNTVTCNHNDFDTDRAFTIGGIGFHSSGGTTLVTEQNIYRNTIADTITGNCYLMNNGGNHIFQNAYATVCGSNLGFRFQGANLGSNGNSGQVYCETNVTTCVSYDSLSGHNNMELMGGIVVSDSGQQNNNRIRGYMRAGTDCRVGTAIGISSATQTTLCDFPLLPTPNPAVVWAWNCNFSWQVSAGTAPTISFLMNSASAPTTETGSGIIYETNASNGAVTAVQASATSTASGNVAIVTTGALTPSATNFQALLWGTVTTPAVPGSSIMDFSITGTLTPGNATGQLNAGSSCRVF